MITTVLFALALSPTAAQAAPSPESQGAVTAMSADALDLEQRAGLRCAVAFALQEGARGANDDQTRRGREFFVRTMAVLAENTGLTREQLGEEATAIARELAGQPDRLGAMMPACLVMLPSPAASPPSATQPPPAS